MNFRAASIFFLVFLDVSHGKKLRGTSTKFQDDVHELIETAGYECEVHQVETQDGYILKVHRIKPKTINPRLGPVFFMHGLFATAADFVMTGAEQSLPFLLSSNGYDIWLGNARGTDHSLRHKRYNATSSEFWDFSWHEIGFYDVPTMIDYALEQTSSSRTFFVGHSQGTTAFMVMLSCRPEYNDKIIQGHLLAPAVIQKNFPHPMKNFASEIRSFAKPEGYLDISKNSPLSLLLGFNKVLCQENSPLIRMCENVVMGICGQNKGEVEIDRSILQNIMSHLSHFSSARQLEHFLQGYTSGEFRQYDFEGKNMKIYGSPTPPAYNLKNVTAPIYLYSGSCDLMVSERDVEHLREVLPNVRKYRSFKNYNHCDFNYGKNSRALYQNDILKDMNSEKN